MQQPSDESMAGYRVVRKLGSGSRADVYLGVGTAGPVVLKVFRPELSRDDVGAELDALARLDSPHCVRLLDVSGHPDLLPIAILNRVGRGSLAALLRDRDSLERGEAVTLLAPLAGVLPLMHGLGVAHTRMNAASVHLGGSGEPVLIGFGHCRLFDAGASVAALAAEPAVIADRQALAGLVAAVLTRVRGADVDRAIADFSLWLTEAPDRDDFADQLEERLFQLAEPMPIEFGRVSATPARVPARIDEHGGDSTLVSDPPSSIQRQVSVTVEADESAGSITASPAFLPGFVPEWIATAIMNNPLTALTGRLRSAAATVRKPVWLIAGAVALALFFALALIPQGGDSPAVGHPAEPATDAPAVAGSRSAPSGSSASVLPTDPVLALPLLLTARTGCIRDLSVLCLYDVDEQSSGAFDADAQLIRDIQGGAETPGSTVVNAKAPQLVERLGDTALIDLDDSSGSAAVLLIRDPAGWRIRGFLAETPSSGSAAGR